MSHYSVSERLQGMMCTEPVIHPSKPTESAPNSPGSHSYGSYSPSSRNSRSKSLAQPHARIYDIESGHRLSDFIDLEEMHKAESFKGLTFTQVTNQIWHFCSVDHGPRCKSPWFSIAACSMLMAVLDTCIGYNSLYVIPNVETTNGKDLPDGKRLWSWLILFDDGEDISLT